MDLLLNNTKMRSIQNIRTEWESPSFSFTELWDTAMDGSLNDFQQDLNHKTTSEQGKALIREIMLATVNLRAETPCALSLSLDGPSAGSRDRLDVSGFLREHPALRASLAQVMGTSPRRRWAVYLFLLLHMQIKPKLPVRSQDVEDFLLILDAMRDSLLTDLSHVTRLAISRKGYLRCLESKIQLRRGGAWEVIYEAPGPIASLCVLDDDVLVVLLSDGTLAPCTPEHLRSAARNRKILQISAWGPNYILLCDDGTALSNLDVSDWQNLHWVHMGTNSVCGISGPVCRAVQLFSDPALCDRTGLKAVYTRTTDDDLHYALLFEDDTLVTDTVPTPLPQVDAAALSMFGCVYIRKGQLWLRPYQTAPDMSIATLPKGFNPGELHCRNDLVLCGTPENPFAARIPHILPIEL